VNGLEQGLDWLLNAQLTIGEQHILWREIIGNLFGLASAIGGMRRRVWAWPVGIAGNVLLFTVFLGAAFNTPQGANLLGQASRQVMFIVVSIYGWVRWSRTEGEGGPAVHPHWASTRQRVAMVLFAVVMVAALTPIFRALGSFEPVWADAWIFTGSLLATYAMARGWVEFWLIWIAVDAVGVPLLLRAHLYPSAILYGVYAGFVLWGFVVWLRVSRAEAAELAGAATSPAEATP
jgi:nicotinamide mononucleotide transporter